jgi:hypothetical protein
MFRRLSRRQGPWLLAVALAAAALSLAAAPVVAFQGTQSGVIGPHHVFDSVTKPGGKCVYATKALAHHTKYTLIRMKVTGPKVEYPDSLAADHGKVGFKARIQALQPDDSWKTVRTSSETRMRVTDVAYKTFATRTLAFTGSRNVVYRAALVLTWYGSGGSVQGRLKGHLENHRISFDHSDGNEDCAGVYTGPPQGGGG